MPDQNQTTNNLPSSQQNADDVIVSPVTPEPAPVNSDATTTEPTATVKTVADHIQGVHNILIALSSDPSVDEITAAIGLSLYLDRIGKRATSIYSGQTPNILEFLQPEKTFESNADVLRDFVIALDKNKADHLRYKLDGDYVKIFITPYKTRIDASDFDFSLGDFNIELVLALNVPSGIDLDDALREHGRVMHDATVINITNGNPGKFGDIEWNDKSKSSISEMVARLLYELGGKDAIKADEATALLTGIISATDHFSNNSTTADSMQISAQLINSGANRELISENISLESQNMFFHATNSKLKDESSTLLDINHDNQNPATDTQEEIVADLNNNLPDLNAVVDDLAKAEALVKPYAEELSTQIGPTPSPVEPDRQTSLTTPPVEPITQPTTQIEDSDILVMPTIASLSSTETLSSPTISTNHIPDTTIGPNDSSTKSETTITPSEDFATQPSDTSNYKYGQMLEDALAETDNEPSATPTIETTPSTYTESSTYVTPTEPTMPTVNPASSVSPAVATKPDINGVPIINYSAMSNDNILPPPPAPPVDPNSLMPPVPQTDINSALPPTPQTNVSPVMPTMPPSI